MKLITTVSWSALASAIRILTALISIKVVAVIIGPKGVAIIGQFNNLIAIVLSLIMSGIGTAVVTYTSKFKDEYSQLKKYWANASQLIIVSSLIVGILLILSSQIIARLMLQQPEYSKIIIIFGFTIILYACNQLLTSITNGLHFIKIYNIINILNAICSLVVTLVLVKCLGLYGAVVALVVSQIFSLAITIIILFRQPWLRLSSFIDKFDKQVCKELLAYSLMAFVSMCSLPLSQMFVRSYLITKTSWDIGGCWQGMQSISNNYLSIVYTAIGTYYLPKLANLNEKQLIQKEIVNGYKILMPIVILISFSIYLSRNFITHTLFAPDFYPMQAMYPWQLIGDCFKIASWIFSYAFLAKNKMRILISTEIIFGVSFVGLSTICINYFGNNGAVIAFAANSFIYWFLFMVLYKNGQLYK